MFPKYLFQLLKRLRHDTRGTLLVFILISGAVATFMVVSGIASYAMFEHKASQSKHYRDLAFHIAEAGSNYYRWHLAHSPTDYTDGTELPGPYVHPYEDKNGEVIGYFSLEISPPLTGSTIVTVRSTGWTVADPDNRRTIQVRVGFPALTNFTFLHNANMAFSPTTIVHGPVHSNGGIEFNGTTDAAVESARETYTIGWTSHPGVWGTGGPTEFWNFPVPAEDFAAITADLSAIRDMAIDDGIYLTSSGVQGWYLSFQNNGTVDVYRVESRLGYWTYTSGIQQYDRGTSTFVANYPIPTNGAIFVEDRTWVDGVVDGRVTVGAGRFPVVSSTYQDIIISGNLVYEEQASDDVIGLIAQRNIIVPRNVPTDMVVNAAALAQFGQLSRPSYFASILNSLTFFGSQIGYNSGGWKWGSPVISGFINTYHLYDGNLRYYPPPGFPVGTVYDLLSWEEIEE